MSFPPAPGQSFGRRHVELSSVTQTSELHDTMHVKTKQNNYSLETSFQLLYVDHTVYVFRETK